MHFEKYGKGSPILFLHGWGCDLSVFYNVVHQLPNFTCYLVDFAGFGKSKNPPVEGWTIFDYVQDVVRFLEEQGLNQVTIVGHSFGCRVAMVLASMHPKYVKKMLLVAPAGIRKPSFKRWCKVLHYKIGKFLCRLGFIQNVTARHGSADYNACENSMKNTFVKVVNQDLSHYAKGICCPTLIINGNTDTQTTLKHAKCLQKLIKNSSLVEIDGGHFALFEHPKAFARTIQLFEDC